MKLMSILLKEGRKEDLIKKYEEKFNGIEINNVINDPFIKQTNYKYADFILKHLNENYSFSDLDDVIEALKKFDKIQSNLEKKDINTYTGFFDLISIVNEYTKYNEKPKSKKIYEDNKFIVVEPQNYVASCKYGSKTRWCTATKNNDSYFNSYTSGRQGLYYVISKKDLEENLYKIAIHFGNYDEVKFYDASDSTFGKREIALFKSAYPEMWDAINEYQDKIHSDKTKERVIEALSDFTERTEDDYIGKGAGEIQLKLLGFQYVENNGDTFMANNELQIFDIKSRPKVLLDNYLLFIEVSLKKKNGLSLLDVYCSLESYDNDIKLDLELQEEYFESTIAIFDISNIANEISRVIFANIFRLVYDNNSLLSYFHKSAVWRPDRLGYGYTFENNKGLIKKLVDWLDEDKLGTKLDFLVDIGKLDKKIENNKTLYSQKGNNKFTPSINWRGHFASFFASAKMAGILSYKKVGNRFFLKKGLNFEAFKNGNLKAI